MQNIKRETIMINVWIVSYFNAFDGLNYNNLHNTPGDAIANFDEIVNNAIKSASEEIGDFRVSRNVDSLTICDIEDDRVVIMCEVTTHTITCGTMCM